MNSAPVVEHPDTDFVLNCDHLPGAQAFYIDELEFRLQAVFPADNPRVVVLKGYGITIALQQVCRTIPAASTHAASTVVQRLTDGAFGPGRAGMQYRDLIPDRLGGKYIASHIRIPTGGPVADYVHYHDVRFQLIFCYKGWVRLVYEDQGPSFIIRPGDCVLQPPRIRHRVLECSDNMEVVEIACPAEHKTTVEHDLQLPTRNTVSDKRYGGQHFVCQLSATAVWRDAPITGFSQRDTGIATASNGIASAVVLRSSAAPDDTTLRNDEELFFVFVLNGTSCLEGVSMPGCDLRAGDAFVVPPARQMQLSQKSADLLLLLVTSNG